MREDIVLIGGGGHCKVVIDAIKNANAFNIYGITDQNPDKIKDIPGIPVLGNDDMLQEIYGKGIKYAFITVGSIGNCTVRKKIAEKLKKIGFQLPVIVHPRAITAKDVSFKEGAFVAAGAVINPGAKIGKNVIINTSSSIDHDCVIGNFAHIAPGVILSGGVKIGEGTHVGTGAHIVQYLSVPKNSFIPAGSVVHKLKDGTVTWTRLKFHDEKALP